MAVQRSVNEQTNAVCLKSGTKPERDLGALAGLREQMDSVERLAAVVIVV